MFVKMISAATLSVALFAGGASASTVPVIGTNADYDGYYTANNAYPNHGLWLPHLLKSNGSSLSRHWSIDAEQSWAFLDDGTLTMNGVAKNLDNSDLQLAYSINLVEIEHDDGLACGNSSTSASSCNSNDATDVAERERAQFFTLDQNAETKISGIGLLEGLELTFAIRPTDQSKPPQLGFGGNWKNMEFGYSNWFNYTTNVSEIAGYDVKAASNGDVNLTFSDNDRNDNNPPPVPLPAGLPLLLGGLAAFGFVRSRRA